MLTEKEFKQFIPLLSLCCEVIDKYNKELSHVDDSELELWDNFIDMIDELSHALNDPNRCPKCGETDWDYANIGFTNAITCLHCGSIRMKNEEETTMSKQRNNGVAMCHLFARKEKNGNVTIKKSSGELVASFPSYLSNKPTYRNKYVTINCNEYKLFWIKE